MHISEEYAVRLVKENQELRRQLRIAQGELQEKIAQKDEDIDFLQRCLFISIKQNDSTLRVSREMLDMPPPKFKLDENISGEMLIRIARRRR